MFDVCCESLVGSPHTQSLLTRSPARTALDMKSLVICAESERPVSWQYWKKMCRWANFSSKSSTIILPLLTNSSSCLSNDQLSFHGYQFTYASFMWCRCGSLSGDTHILLMSPSDHSELGKGQGKWARAPQAFTVVETSLALCCTWLTKVLWQPLLRWQTTNTLPQGWYTW